MGPLCRHSNLGYQSALDYLGDGNATHTHAAAFRRSQGIFKANTRLLETKYRVTGVANIKHLRASHIKPWKDADNHKKLGAANGLLLSPHADHLCNRGFISFDNSGEILVSGNLNPIVLQQWSIHTPSNVGSFRKEPQD